MKANRKQNGVKLTESKPNHANQKKTEEVTCVAALTALVKFSL